MSPLLQRFLPQTIRDQIAYFNNPARLRVPAFSVISRVQDHTPGEQILGTAVALIAMCQTLNVPLQDVLTKAGNALADAEGPFSSHLQAVRDYARNELTGG